MKPETTDNQTITLTVSKFVTIIVSIIGLSVVVIGYLAKIDSRLAAIERTMVSTDQVVEWRDDLQDRNTSIEVPRFPPRHFSRVSSEAIEPAGAKRN